MLVKVLVCQIYSISNTVVHVKNSNIGFFITTVYSNLIKDCFIRAVLQ